jgi:isoamylase
MLGDFATRVTGSSDLYGHGRQPTASVNLVTVHDGFTLADLVSYDSKHNEANGEGNRDGTDDNRSWNCGVEGATEDPEVLALRACQRRNLLATLMLSKGVPLLLGGDELGRTQGGNNNAYCQDNDVSWVDWSLAGGDGDLTEFVAGLVKLRMSHPALHSRRFFAGDDIQWLRPDGGEMTDADWSESFARAVAVTSATGPLVLLVNSWWEPLTFQLPEGRRCSPMSVVVDTAGNSSAPSGGEVTVGPRSLLVLSG